MDKKIIKINGKVIEVNNGVIKATTEEIARPDGRVDVIVHVPCLQIAGNIKER